MHIPSHMMNGAVCPVTAVIGAAGVSLAALRAFMTGKGTGAARFAAITALIFAGQMMNFPIKDGTSGHLIGAVLAVALMGIPFGILSISVVVAVQCLFFSDGGLGVLGANILNMALVGAGLGGLIYKYVSGGRAINSAAGIAGLMIASWSSVMLAAFACSVELAVSGTIAFSKVVTAMLMTHSLIGIGEALITVAACFALGLAPARTAVRRPVVVPLSAAFIIAALLSPFASGFPDGLEWVALKYEFLHESAPAFVGLMPDYSMPFIGNEAFSVGAAGAAGVAITFIVALSVSGFISRTFRVADRRV